jgi:hypothetical protein
MRFVLASYLAVALATPRDNVSQDSAAGPPHDVERGPPSRAAALKTFSRAFPLYSDAVAWDAIEWRKYKTIIISGPQRSGTTYFCKALAAHLGYKRLDEGMSAVLEDADGAPSINVRKMRVGKREIVDETSAVLRARERVVMQRPQWSYALHLLPPSPDLLVIVLARNCLDVLISQNRIKWTCTHGEFESSLFKAEAEINPALTAAAGDLDDMVCAVKQRAYKHYQAAALARKGVATYAVAYTSFGTLSGFVNNTRARKAFKPKQIAPRISQPDIGGRMGSASGRPR